MRQNVTNLESYIIGQIGICSEIDYALLQEKLDKEGFTKKAVLNTVSDLVVNKILTKYKFEKSALKSEKRKGGVYNPSDVIMLRLSKVQGDEALKSISDELFMHFELYAGKAQKENKIGKRYTGNRVKTKRLENSARIMQRLYYSNIGVDYCDLVFNKLKKHLDRSPRPAVKKTTKEMLQKGLPQTIFDVKQDKLLDFRAIIARCDRNLPTYITSKALHAKDPGQTYHSRSDMARHHGILMTAAHQYMVYFIDNPESRWSRDIEETYKTYYADIIKDGYTLSVRPELGGLFFVENVDMYEKVLIADKSLKGVYDPISVFTEDARLIPIYDPSYDVSYEYLLYGLTIKGFTDAVNDLIWDMMQRSVGITIERVEGKNYFAVYKGRKIYSAIDCKLNPLFEAKREILAGNNCIVFCNAWQKDAVINYLELTEDQVNKQIVVYKDTKAFEEALSSINKLPKKKIMEV